MNLWLRLLAFLLTAARSRPALALPGDTSVLHFRVWPHDLDPALHMNNGRYLSIMDLGRLDTLIRSGLWRIILRHRWTPIASGIQIRFSRELRLFDRFRLETRLLAWDDTRVVMEQVFVIASGAREGQVAARALFKGGLYDRAARSFVPVARMMEETGAMARSPAPSPEVAAFLAADDALRVSGASSGS
jgi:acyl-CoA thioesterase FadM